MFDYHKPDGAPIDWWKSIHNYTIPRRSFIWIESDDPDDGSRKINPYAGYMESITKDTNLHHICDVAAGTFVEEQREIYYITKTPELFWEIQRGEIVLPRSTQREIYILASTEQGWEIRREAIPLNEPWEYVTALTLLALERGSWEVLRYANYLNRSYVSVRFQSDFQFYWEDVCLSEPETMISIFNPRIPLTSEEEYYLSNRLDSGGVAERWWWEDAEGNLTNEGLRLSLDFAQHICDWSDINILNRKRGIRNLPDLHGIPQPGRKEKRDAYILCNKPDSGGM